MKRIQVFTDGSSRPRTKETAGWAAAFKMNGLVHVFYGHYPAPATNNIGELGATMMMMRIFGKANISFDFVTDSEYVKKGYLEYRKGWEGRGMKNNQGKPISNLEMWVESFKRWDAANHTVEWVRGHSGELMNEIADYWANAGADNISVEDRVADEAGEAKFWRGMKKYTGVLGSGTPGDVIHEVDIPPLSLYRVVNVFRKEMDDDTTE